MWFGDVFNLFAILMIESVRLKQNEQVLAAEHKRKPQC